MKEKSFDLFSKNEEVNSILNNMKLNSKVYTRLISGLQLLGNFDKKIEIDFYDKTVDDEEQKIRFWCIDSDDNLFIFYGFSSDRKDILKIIKNTNEEELEYDLSLAKKFDLNSNNINFTRFDQTYEFKFGRLITDRNNFYSLFLGNNIGYQIQGDLNINIVKELLCDLNKLDNPPKLTDYLNVFENILTIKNINFSVLSISSYKDFENIGFLQIDNEKSKNLTLKK